jgi:hypothetical protein
VNHDRHAVGSEPDIELEKRAAQPDGVIEGGYRILRSDPRTPAMCGDDYRGHGTPQERLYHR